jgi:redox-sensitive bicupin YhaK (pirin superfamily)
MPIEIRRDDTIHRTDGGWFEARWHFSFGHYHDPARMGIGPLRVFNDDRLVPGAVWPMHPHHDVESLTYVVEGSFGHADSLGNGGHAGTRCRAGHDVRVARCAALGAQRRPGPTDAVPAVLDPARP